MKVKTPTLPGRASPRSNGFRFEVADVTSTHRGTITDVAPATPASAVANALAARLALPANVPWVLRDDSTGNYLEDKTPIGDQIEPDSHLTIAPRTHLGAR